ncbi:hypothetical protein BKA67DRAFT_249597 [Truncatella angustata]|uniref:Uncharacterized protein n=1 Tax=Truncatella angustata TaxID=152316 RepID=A0A9P9A061_9PEZI|nr:uncharacterized protein BKA67DRAFT_249597 [Truncatella angustata]KAH6655780.1 hypothetical protein BKA67DRAFT_249597 [Truncatella angustata]
MFAVHRPCWQFIAAFLPEYQCSYRRTSHLTNKSDGSMMIPKHPEFARPPSCAITCLYGGRNRCKATSRTSRKGTIFRNWRNFRSSCASKKQKLQQESARSKKSATTMRQCGRPKRQSTRRRLGGVCVQAPKEVLLQACMCIVSMA